MNRSNDGGPAFPMPFSAVAAGKNNNLNVPFPGDLSQGMTLRDVFAAVALHAMISKVPYAYKGDQQTKRSAARGALAYADEMLSAMDA
jgi:hypothetical protein